MSQCREIRIKSVHNMYYGRFCHFTYENTLKNRDIPMVFIQMVPVPLVTNCIILHMYLLDRVMANSQYICSSTSHSILSISHIPTLSPHSPSPHPQYLYQSISISPISPYPSSLFPHFPPSQHFFILPTISLLSPTSIL